MQKTKAPKSTPSPTGGVIKPHLAVGKSSSQSSVFITMALDMSWRLAIAVLAPIIGGVELDKALNTVPLLTIVGLVLALGGMTLVMWRTLQTANRLPAPKLSAAQKRAIKRQYAEDDD